MLPHVFDIAEIYDNFTPSILLTLEGLEFYGRGRERPLGYTLNASQ